MDRTTVAVSLTFTLAGAATLHWATQGSETTHESAVVIACGGAPETNEEVLRREAAVALIALANDWDDDAFRELRGTHTRGDAIFEPQSRFIHDALGECGAPQLHRHGKRKSRYYADCERGRMEVAPQVDGDGRLVKAYWGAQGVEPGAGVRDAAEALLDLARDWDADFAVHLLSEHAPSAKIQARVQDEFERSGACQIDSVDIAGVRGAIFVLECEGGMRRMKVALDEDLRVRKVKFWSPRRHRPGHAWSKH